VETRVKSTNAKEVVGGFLPNWRYINNYSCHDLGHIGSFGVMKMSLLVMIKETSNVLALLYMPQIMVWRGKPCGGFWRGFRLKLTVCHRS
jgi:hypothetical protein